jgi:hypothetical protein
MFEKNLRNRRTQKLLFKRAGDSKKIKHLSSPQDEFPLPQNARVTAKEKV